MPVGGHRAHQLLPRAHKERTRPTLKLADAASLDDRVRRPLKIASEADPSSGVAEEKEGQHISMARCYFLDHALNEIADESADEVPALN